MAIGGCIDLYNYVASEIDSGFGVRSKENNNEYVYHVMELYYSDDFMEMMEEQVWMWISHMEIVTARIHFHICINGTGQKILRGNRKKI